MAENAQEGLAELLSSLRRIDARGVADEITRVIARGTTEEIEIKGKIKELSQRPLNADEAYNVAIEMLVASLEPMIMKAHALAELENITDEKSSIVWSQDYVEKSPIATESYEDIVIQDVDGVQKLESDLKQVVELLGEA